MSSLVPRVHTIRVLAMIALLASSRSARAESPTNNAPSGSTSPGNQPDLAGEVKAAARKVAAGANYSWKVTRDLPVDGDRLGVALITTGKTAQGGYTTINAFDYAAVIKGDQAAVSAGQHGVQWRWRTMDEASRGRSDRLTVEGAAALNVRHFKFPPSEAEELLDLAHGIQNSDTATMFRPPTKPSVLGSFEKGATTNPTHELPESSAATRVAVAFKAYSAELTEAGARAFLPPGVVRAVGIDPGARNGLKSSAEIINPKGKVKFWIVDGVLSKFEYQLQATIRQDGREREYNQTFAIEITDVGTTKIDVPAEATAKLSPINEVR